MPTTVIRFGLSSKDIVSDSIALSDSQSLTTDGTAGLDLTSGLTRIKVGTSAETILDASTFSNNGESQLGYIYIKNFSATPSSIDFTDSIIIKLDDGSNQLTLGHLPGGHAAILPYSANNDLTITADVADTGGEYIHIHEG